jgi:Carboxymuconolactone decarboxylase family
MMQEKVKPKINLVEEADATGDLAKIYDECRAQSGRPMVPDILKCFSHRPDFLLQVIAFSNGVHFSDGHLDRKTKEAIATYVSYLNRCPY